MEGKCSAQRPAHAEHFQVCVVTAAGEVVSLPSGLCKKGGLRKRPLRPTRPEGVTVPETKKDGDWLPR